MKCSAIDCRNKVKFKFPSNKSLKKKWLDAIGRSIFEPRPSHGLCSGHFNPKDIISESYRSGYKLQNIRLKQGAIPFPKAIFKQSSELQGVQSKENLSDAHAVILSNAEEGEQPTNNAMVEFEMPFLADMTNEMSTPSQSSESSSGGCVTNDCDVNECDIETQSVSNVDALAFDVETYEEEVYSYVESAQATKKTNETVRQNNETVNQNNSTAKRTMSTQTYTCPRYTIEDFKNKPKVLLHLTGLENYDKFQTVLYSLGPGVYNLNYVRKNIGNLDIPDQLFLVLWKLRRYPSDIELAEHFSIDEVAVGNIFITWILFMSETWSYIDLWPSREVIDFYMPDNFKQNYPKARLIVDGTEIKTEAAGDPNQRQSSFSFYKNSPTMKTLIGGTPGGLISYYSPAYAGSSSDRQIIERSDLCKKCQPGDSVIADKGFLVQDIFAPYNVTVATPTPLIEGSIPHKTVLKDRKLSKHRVHVERFIGLLKTFTILSKTLNHHYISLTSEIVGVCVMLTNFKENIMKTKANY